MKKWLISVYFCVALVLMVGMALVSCAKPAVKFTPSPAPASATTPTPSDKTWPKSVSWGGSTTGATYTVMATAMCQQITKYTGVTASAEATGGSSSSFALINKNQMEFCTALADANYQGSRGIGDFQQIGKVPVRALFSQHDQLFSGLVPADSSIYKISDWRGKRVMCDNRGTPSIKRTADLMLKQHGMSINDVTVQVLPGGGEDRIAAIREKTTDVLCAIFTPATPWITQLSLSTPIRFMDIDEAKLDNIIKESAWYHKSTIPAGSYKGVQKDYLMVGIEPQAVCHRDLPEGFVYAVMKAIWDHFDELKPAQPDFKTFQLEKILTTTVIPIHPGAIKYYKEKGLWNAACDKKQSSLLKEIGEQ